jgi:hypothetical protein
VAKSESVQRHSSLASLQREISFTNHIIRSLNRQPEIPRYPETTQIAHCHQSSQYYYRQENRFGAFIRISFIPVKELLIQMLKNTRAATTGPNEGASPVA